MAEALSNNLKRIGRYTILRELRRDRYTVAYLAFDPVLNRELVLKAVQLQPAAGRDTAGHDRIEQAFMRQAQAAGRLHHPHIVTVFDAGRFERVGYLALERVEGKMLDELLAEGFKPGFLHAADIAARVADAVEYAHARGIPHGHLGSSRIYLYGAEKSPKVMGFGGWIDSGSTGDFELAGTESLLPYFRSDLDPQARRKDVRALGALLFLLLTGERPDINRLRARKARESAILELRPTAPLPLAEIAEGALELTGSRPFGTAAQFRNALTTFLWGNRGAQGLPNAATITGMPARLEIVPGGALAVPTVRTSHRPLPPPPKAAQLRPHIVAIAAAGLAIIAIAWFALQRPAPVDVALQPSAGNAAPLTKPAPIDADEAAAAHAEAVEGVTAEDSATAVALPAEPTVARARTAAQTTRFGTAPVTPAAQLAPLPTQGLVAFAVVPWGEIFINGRSQGTTPPVTQLMLPAGRHTIELRNGARPSFVAQVDVVPDRPQQIRHRFQ